MVNKSECDPYIRRKCGRINNCPDISAEDSEKLVHIRLLGEIGSSDFSAEVQKHADRFGASANYLLEALTSCETFRQQIDHTARRILKPSD
jgi:hypothetical protein